MFEEEIWSDDIHTDIFFFPIRTYSCTRSFKGRCRSLYTTLEFVDHDSSTSTYFVSHGVTASVNYSSPVGYVVHVCTCIL